MSDEFLRNRPLESAEHLHSERQSERYPLLEEPAVEQLKKNVLPGHSNGEYTYVGRIALLDKGKYYDRTGENITKKIKKIAKEASAFRTSAGR